MTGEYISGDLASLKRKIPFKNYFSSNVTGLGTHLCSLKDSTKTRVVSSKLGAPHIECNKYSKIVHRTVV